MKKIALPLLLIFMVISYSHAQIFHEDFEFADSVTSSGSGWFPNTNLQLSGLSCDSASIQFPGDVSKLTTIPFSTTGINSVFLYFNHICKIEFFDNGMLEVSLDSGLTWIALNDDIGNPLYNCYYLGLGVFRLQSSRFQEASHPIWQPGTTTLPDNSWWIREVFDLTPILANVPNAMLRFVLADGNNTGSAGRSGWYIDDILISDTLDFNSLPISNRVMGQAYFDYNANQVMDGTDMPVVNHSVRLGIYPFSIGTTDNTGHYSTYVQKSGTVYISPWNYGQQTNYYNVIPPIDSALFSGWQQTDSQHDFAFQPTGVYDDLLLMMTHHTRIRPGMEGLITLAVKNQGTTTQNATLVMYHDTSLTYQTTIIGLSPTSVTADSIVWNVNNMTPLSSELIIVKFLADASLIMDTVLLSNAIVYPVAGDNFPSDNYGTTNTLVTNSYDPNDITVYPEVIFTPELANDPVLEYTIHFQNTGNDTAFYVRIDQMIPPELDMNSYELIASSHDVLLYYDGPMRYTFNNIMLPDSMTNPEKSQGFITFRIRPYPGLVAGDTIRSQASIYFDINPPIITNTAKTAIVDPLSFQEFDSGVHDMKLYPNPANGSITVNLPVNAGKNAQVEIFNVLGSVVYSVPHLDQTTSSSLMQFDISNFPAGVYTVVYSDETTKSAARFVKMNW